MRSEGSGTKAVPTLAKSFARAWALVRRIARNDILLVNLALGVLIIIFFYDIIFLGRTLVTSSFMWGVMGQSTPFGYPSGPPDYNVYLLDPLASAVGAEPTVEKAGSLLRDLQLPLWDTNLALGRPLLASLGAIVSPIRLPLMLWPSPEMWDIFLIARFFVAGLFTYLLAKRLGLTKLAAFGSGVAFAFSGFFMLYVNMPHADYAATIPILLYAFELLLERPSPRRMIGAAAAVAIGILADNPESAVLLLLYGATYYLARAFARARVEDEFPFWGRIPPLAMALTAGVGLTAFTLVPFLELSGSLGLGGLAVEGRHAPGSDLGTKFAPMRHLVSLFIPYFDGPPVQNFQGTGWTGIRNYSGVVIPLLAFVGILNRRAMGRSGLFFLGAGVVLLSKTYGVPAVNWMGQLPILDVIDFGLYSAPLIGFSLAMLAGLGLDELSRPGGRWWHPLLALIVLTVFLGWLVWLNRGILGDIPDLHLTTQLSFAGGLIVVTVLVIVAMERSLLPLNAGRPLLVGLIAIELFVFTTPAKGEFASLASEVYGTDEIPVIDRPQRHDPFTKPPYVTFLEEDTSTYRVLGLDYVLYPNTGRAYDIDDVRGFTATTVRRYLRFIQRFINPSVRSRFTGAYLPPLRSENEPAQLADNPMLDLLNVKYIITPRGLPQAYDYQLTETFLAAWREKASVRADVFTINGEDDIVLFQHPPSSISYEFTPSEESRFVLFRLAMDPIVWAADKGDGVHFEVSVRGEEEKKTLFSKWVDPKSRLEDRRWIDSAVDLEQFLGQSVTLELSTSPGKSPSWDWAGWGGLRLAPSLEAPAASLSSSQLEVVYDEEVKIYENHNVMPRAFIVHRAVPARGQDEAIALMNEHHFDPTGQAVIEGDLSEEQLAALTASPIADASSVEITHYGDTRVELLARMKNAGLLVLSDTYYPGWKAYVDGKKVPVYPTDLALRSVFVPPGEHEVEFVFSPQSFKLGASITAASLAMLGLYVAWRPATRAARCWKSRNSSPA